jgi:hypothetical protein
LWKAIPVDTTGDLVPNAVGLDTTGDGKLDCYGIPIDTTGDGLADCIALDTAGDNKVDTLVRTSVATAVPTAVAGGPTSRKTMWTEALHRSTSREHIVGNSGTLIIHEYTPLTPTNAAKRKEFNSSKHNQSPNSGNRKWSTNSEFETEGRNLPPAIQQQHDRRPMYSSLADQMANVASSSLR